MKHLDEQDWDYTVTEPMDGVTTNYGTDVTYYYLNLKCVV